MNPVEESRGTPTAETIARSYDRWIVVRRCVGAGLDYLLLGGMLCTAELGLGQELYEKTLALWLGLIVVYFPITEGLTGHSFGKWIVRTKVVDADGRAPGIKKASIRNLWRALEANPCCGYGLAACIQLLVIPTRQRLGDIMAGTFVLRTRDLHLLDPIKERTDE